MWWKIMSGIIRHVLTTMGGVLVTKGYLEQSEFEQVIGALMLLIGAGHSVWVKWKAQRDAGAEPGAPGRAQSPKGASLNMLLALGVGSWLLGTVGIAQAQTPSPAPSGEGKAVLGSTNAFNFLSWATTFFTDNTNFFGQRTLIAGVAPLYSRGHDVNKGTADSDNFGGVLSLEFPLDPNGQVSIGMWAAYFNSEASYGSINATLGKTLMIPEWLPWLGGQQLYLSDEFGPGYRWDMTGKPFFQNFTLVTYKHDLKLGLPNPVTFYLVGGHGNADAWRGDIWLLGPQLSYRF
jgi:hypothetical protein